MESPRIPGPAPLQEAQRDFPTPTDPSDGQLQWTELNCNSFFSLPWGSSHETCPSATTAGLAVPEGWTRGEGSSRDELWSPGQQSSPGAMPGSASDAVIGFAKLESYDPGGGYIKCQLGCGRHCCTEMFSIIFCCQQMLV